VQEALDKLLNPPVPLRVGHLYTARVAQILDFGLRLEVRARRVVFVLTGWSCCLPQHVWCICMA